MPIRHDLNRNEINKLESRPFTAYPTYRIDYREHSQDMRRESFKPDSFWMPPPKIDYRHTSKSTYDSDFKKHNIKPLPLQRSSDTIMPRSAETFSKNTGYIEDFVEHSLPSFFFIPRNEKFSFKTNKRFYKPQDFEIIKSKNYQLASGDEGYSSMELLNNYNRYKSSNGLNHVETADATDLYIRKKLTNNKQNKKKLINSFLQNY